MQNPPVFNGLFHLLHAVERTNRRFSRQPPQVVYPDGTFAWTAALEAQWRAIRAEFDRVLASGVPVPPFEDIAPEMRALTQDGHWRTYVLHAYGRRAERNCAECPVTAAACEAIPGMKTAFFSILDPGKTIAAHRGPYNGLLRCHLGLVVPRSADALACGMRVGERTVTWQEGRALVFDDTHEHEVWNRTDGQRVVLFLDVLRPMRFPMDHINAALVEGVAASPYGRRCVRRFEAWYRSRGVDATAAPEP